MLVPELTEPLKTIGLPADSDGAVNDESTKENKVASQLMVNSDEASTSSLLSGGAAEEPRSTSGGDEESGNNDYLFISIIN